MEVPQLEGYQVLKLPGRRNPKSQAVDNQKKSLQLGIQYTLFGQPCRSLIGKNGSADERYFNKKWGTEHELASTRDIKQVNSGVQKKRGFKKGKLLIYPSVGTHVYNDLPKWPKGKEEKGSL